MRRRALLVPVVAALALGACDLSPTVDVDTPAFQERLAVRSVLTLGQAPTVRVGLARDPFAVAAPDVAQPTPTDVTVTLWRGDALVETLPLRSQTCYAQSTSACDAATGEVVTERSGPYECGDYRGEVAVGSGAYTLRAERPGLPAAEATVVVPETPDGTFSGAQGPAGYAFDLSVVDADPAPGTAFGVSLLREFDAFATRYCAVGGERDTTVFLPAPATYTTTFGTDDPTLRAEGADLDGTFNLIVFDDATFPNGEGRFTMTAPLEGTLDRRGTGRFVLQIARLSPVLYDYLRETVFPLDAPTPFDEPANLPSNVTGGYGHVGAVATRELLTDAN